MTPWISHAVYPLQVGLSACLWIGFYYLNGWLFSALALTETSNWVFLPAAIRLLAVLLFGWRGAFGLLIGTLITNVPHFGLVTASSVAVATLSAMAPYIAVQMGRTLLRLPSTLHGITGLSLLQLGALSAVCSVVLHSLLFAALGASNGVYGFVSMLVGDIVGTLLVLYALRALLVFHERRGRKIGSP